MDFRASCDEVAQICWRALDGHFMLNLETGFGT